METEKDKLDKTIKLLEEISAKWPIGYYPPIPYYPPGYYYPPQPYMPSLYPPPDQPYWTTTCGHTSDTTDSK